MVKNSLLLTEDVCSDMMNSKKSEEGYLSFYNSDDGQDFISLGKHPVNYKSDGILCFIVEHEIAKYLVLNPDTILIPYRNVTEINDNLAFKLNSTIHYNLADRELFKIFSKIEGNQINFYNLTYDDKGFDWKSLFYKKSTKQKLDERASEILRTLRGTHGM